MDSWITSWHEFSADPSVHDMAHSHVEGLYKLVRQDRGLFQELMEARADPNTTCTAPLWPQARMINELTMLIAHGITDRPD